MSLFANILRIKALKIGEFVILPSLRQNLEKLPLGLRTRFAPSPTGYLHLGHVASALYVWGIAQARQGHVLLRIEDHDAQRCRPEFTAALVEDLEWLQLIDATTESSIQSDHPQRYVAALASLEQKAEVYACTCSRKAIAERLTREPPRSELFYDGYCRSQRIHATTELTPGGAGLRLHLPPQTFVFDDLMQGAQEQTPSLQCGDLLLRERAGSWTYHFCVTVDDAEEEIDLIIRGTDLLDACGRQRQLAELLGRPTPPYLLHHPLIVDETGQKLSKRFGSTALRTLRASGYTPAEVLGLAAHTVGLLSAEQPIAARDLGGLF